MPYAQTWQQQLCVCHSFQVQSHGMHLCLAQNSTLPQKTKQGQRLGDTEGQKWDGVCLRNHRDEKNK